MVLTAWEERDSAEREMEVIREENAALKKDIGTLRYRLALTLQSGVVKIYVKPSTSKYFSMDFLGLWRSFSCCVRTFFTNIVKIVK